MTMCTHCGLPQRGSAGLSLRKEYFPLCHPDKGLDCYRMVTLYQHPLVNCALCGTKDQQPEND